MKRILVTGGLGFIGSHLADRLLDGGAEVHLVDDLSNPAVLPTHFAYQRDCHVFPLDVVSFCRRHDHRYDEIYHLASPVGAAGVLKHAGRMVRAITDATYALADLALRSNARLLDVSTSEVYGGGDAGLCREDMPRLVPAETTVRLEYAVAKLAAETALLNTAKVAPLDVVIVRPFNVAGARQRVDGGFVLPRFVTQGLHGQPLTVFGEGSQQRAFTHVADICDGLMLAMGRAPSGAVYNLGNPANRTTIRALAERVLDRIGGGDLTFTDGATVYGALFAEAADKYPDATKAMTELGWRPRIGIDETIDDVIAYYSERQAA